MANSVAGLFETLVAAANEATKVPRLPNTMLDCVYTGLQPGYATLGHTLNVILPVIRMSDVEDIGAGNIHETDTTHSFVPVVFNKKPNTSFVIRGFDQTLTPQNLYETYLSTRIEELLRYMDRDICSLVTAANFASYSTITGGSAVFTRNHLKTGWSYLANAGVPVGEDGNFFFVTHTTPYANATVDPTFAQESMVGAAAADQTRKAMFSTQYGAEIKFDPFIPQPVLGTTYSGLLMHRYAIALRTGVEPPMGDGSIRETVVYPRPNIPMKIQTWNSGEAQGMKVNLSICYGRAVVRPDFAAYYVTT